MRRIIIAAALLLSACAATPDNTSGPRRMPDIARSGGVMRSVGAATGMSVGCRALNVARALTRSAGLSRLSSGCSAASRL